MVEAQVRPSRPGGGRPAPVPARPPAADTEREFPFGPDDFARVRKLIYERAGISLSDHKQEMVYSRLARRLRARGLDRFDAYLRLLEQGDADEWEAFTNALTTNLTAFFREGHHFEILAERLRAWGAKRRCRIWCSASSTGEEPYSLAMTLVETFGSWTPPAEIVATDLDTAVLGKAQAGVYTIDRLEKMAPERVRRFFLRGTGSKAGMVRVRPELQRLVAFERLNLLDATWPVRGPFDALFCRNVLIYFDKSTQRRIIEKFRPLVPGDGLLFVGHSEWLQHCADLFLPIGRTVYRPVPAGERRQA